MLPSEAAGFDLFFLIFSGPLCYSLGLAVSIQRQAIKCCSGVKDFNVDRWYGLLVPAVTLPAIVAKIKADVNQALSAPEVRKKLCRRAPVSTSFRAKPFKRSTTMTGGVMKS